LPHITLEGDADSVRTPQRCALGHARSTKWLKYCVMKTKKQKQAAVKKTSRSFGDVVGEDIYAVWVRMLKALVPHGRTHRLSIVLASMLQYATSVTELNQEEETDDGSLASALIQATEVGEPSEVADLIQG